MLGGNLLFVIAHIGDFMVVDGFIGFVSGILINYGGFFKFGRCLQGTPQWTARLVAGAMLLLCI